MRQKCDGGKLQSIEIQNVIIWCLVSKCHYLAFSSTDVYQSSVIAVVIIVIIKTNIKFPCSLPFLRTSSAAKCNLVEMYMYFFCDIAGGIPV